MEIRQLSAEDKTVYQDLRLFGLQESPTAFGASYSEEVERPLQVVAGRLEDERNYVVGAFTDDGQLVGIATLRREEREKLRHKAHVFGMFVLPQYRGQGAGRALLETLIARAWEVGVRQMDLGVTASNEPAVRLYESCGFERYGLEPDAFKVGGDFYDAAYMVLRLGGDA